MASRNGLNPKIKGPKGVGFGRALPAPFGFDNGIFPDGVDDYLSIPAMERNTQFLNDLSIEWWVNAENYYINGYKTIFCITDTINNKFWQSDNYGISVQISSSDNQGYIFTGANSIPLTPKVHIVSTHNLSSVIQSGKTNIYINGDFSISGYSNLTLPFNINRFLLFANVLTINTQNSFWQCPIDEIRIYNKTLRDNEVKLNYNNGIGANPCNTEYLIAWYQFEKFEILDFSDLQDNSDMMLGIRDMSGHNNHAKPFNMDTDSNSPTYILKPF